MQDGSRFERVFDAHQRRVLAYALRRVDTEADAEDVAAETFTIAWRKLDQVPHGDELPWLLGVARRVAANQRRGASRWQRLAQRLTRTHDEQRAIGDGAPSAASPALEALSRLRPDDQELVRLIAWDELSHAEAGMVLGITANAVAIRLHRARKRLADELLKGSAGSRTPTLIERQGRRAQTEGRG